MNLVAISLLLTLALFTICTHSGSSSSSSVLARSAASLSSTKDSTTTNRTLTSSVSSLGNSSVRDWNAASTQSISNGIGYGVANGKASAKPSASLHLNSTAAVPTISGFISVPSLSSSTFIPSQPHITVSTAVSAAAFTSNSSSGSASSPKIDVSLVPSVSMNSPERSPSQSESTALISPSNSSNHTQTISSTTPNSNGTDSSTRFGASTRSQSVYLQLRKVRSSSLSGLAISASTSSRALGLGPEILSRTITSGPSRGISTVYWNPTGSAARPQGMLLVGAIFEITNEARTLSDIVEDEGPKESFVRKIEDTEHDLLKLFDGIHPPSPPPSYDDSCRDSGSIFDIFKTLGCLQSGLDEVIELLEPDQPDVPKVQSIFDNLGTLANNLKEEEDDDDDKSTTDENETKTQKSGTKSRITSEKSESSISVTSNGSKSASLRSSSRLRTAHTTLSSSTAVFTTEVAGVDRSPFFDYEKSEDSGPDIPDQAAMTFFGDILSSAMGIGLGFGLSGSKNSTITGNATLTTTAHLQPAPSAATETSSLVATSTPKWAATSNILGFSNTRSATNTISVVSGRSVVTPEESATPKAVTSRATSSSSQGKGGSRTSTFFHSPPVTTMIPASHTANHPISVHLKKILRCTLLEEIVEAGKDPSYIHSCTCNDGSKPTPVTTSDLIVCPSQVDLIVVGP